MSKQGRSVMLGSSHGWRDLWCGGMAGEIWVTDLSMVALHISLSPQH